MPATTTNLKLPYPLPTDPIADGANQIKALAEAVDTGLLKLAVVKISAKSDNDDTDYHTVNGTAPLPQGFTKLIGGFVNHTGITARLGSFMSYCTINNLSIENNGTQIKVSGMSTSGSSTYDVEALVWGC